MYACVTYNRHGKNHCTQHRVEYDTLYDIVYKEIKKLAKKTIDAEEVARSVAEAYENERKDQARLLEVGIKKAKDRLDVLDRMTTKLYEDLLAQKIMERTFNSMIMRTKKEQDELQKQFVVHEEITKDGDRNITMEIHYNFRPEDKSKTYNLSNYAKAHSCAKAQ